MLRDPPEIASRPTNGSRPTGWEALYLSVRDYCNTIMVAD